MVPRFLVDDIEEAKQVLVQADYTLLGPTAGDGGCRWQHFRGPDGNVYKISQDLDG